VIGEVFAQALLEPADLGGNIGFGEAENLGDFAVTLFIEVEHQQRAIERIETVDHPVQRADAFVRCIRLIGCDIVHVVVECDRVRIAQSRGAQGRDRDVQRDAIEPDRKTARGVVLGKRAPALRDDVLRKIGAIVRAAAVSIRDLEHDLTMAFDEVMKLLLGIGSFRHGGGMGLHTLVFDCAGR